MISIATVFWLLVIIMGIIGGFRGWAKELLVMFSIILAIAIDHLINQYVGPLRPIFFPTEGATIDVWRNSVIIRIFMYFGLAYFGYQSPNIPSLAAGKFARDKLQDWLLGSVIGLLNGYLLIGTLWFFLHQAHYPLGSVSLTPGDEASAKAIASIEEYINVMPPAFMTPAISYFGVVIAFVFVIIVFI